MLTPLVDKKLFLIDAYALIFRAYFSFSKNPRINSKGINTSAAFGFTNTLLDVLNKEKPTHVVVAFDPPGGSKQRKDDFFAYKAHRESTPEDILSNIVWIKQILESLNIPIVQVDGYEADDVIGTLVKIAELQGFQSYMVTPDKDFAQLITEQTKMYRLPRKNEGAKIWGEAQACEYFDINSVNQVVDYLALMGDASDNVPGMPGVGPKTASKLLKEYGTIETIFQHADELKGKQKEIFQTHQQQGLLSKKLVTIITDVPIKFDEQQFKRQPFNHEKIQEVFAELEFKLLLRRILGDTPNPNLFEQNEIENINKTIEITQFDSSIKKYTLVDNKTERYNLFKKLLQQEEVCFDTETTSLDALNADLVGISFSFKEHEAFYVCVPSDFMQAREIVEEFKPFFESKDITKIAHNIKYDLKVLSRYGINVAEPIFDTMIAHYLIDSETRHNMDFLAEKYLKYQTISIEELIGKKGKNQGNMADLPPKEILNYACEDADVTLQLKHVFQQEITKNTYLKTLFEDIEIPLVEVLVAMEKEGVAINKDFLHAYSKKLGNKLNDLESEIKELANSDFNLNSPKQLGEILYEKLQLSEKPKKTKTGQYATSEEVLQSLTDKHAIIPKILEYREYKKLQSTYVDPLPLLCDINDKRIHTQFMQTVTTTGRLSSNNPNLQNIPIRTEAGRAIRAAFIARNTDFVLMSADYSQIELRVIAAISRDKNMLDAFESGEDIHRATASKVYGISLNEVTREQRSAAKAVNFGIIYGQSAFGLSQNLKISRSDAQQIIDSYFQQYPSIQQYMQETISKAKENGYVETICGRKRYLPDIRSANASVRGFAERNAINSPIQGSAADIIKLAMIKVYNEMKNHQLKSNILLQVHDELVFDVHKSEVDIMTELVKTNMENPAKLSIEIPLKVEIGIGENWLDAH